MYADSGIVWIDITFDWCVLFLIKTANQLGITYEEINVWLFVIILPLVLLISLLMNWVLVLKLKKLKKENQQIFKNRYYQMAQAPLVSCQYRGLKYGLPIHHRQADGPFF